MIAAWRDNAQRPRVLKFRHRRKWRSPHDGASPRRRAKFFSTCQTIPPSKRSHGQVISPSILKRGGSIETRNRQFTERASSSLQRKHQPAYGQPQGVRGSIVSDNRIGIGLFVSGGGGYGFVPLHVGGSFLQPEGRFLSHSLVTAVTYSGSPTGIYYAERTE